MLTKTQEKVLSSIKTYYKDFGYSPSIRDLAHDCGLKSTNTVYHHLQSLKEKGYIAMEKSKPRTIRILA